MRSFAERKPVMTGLLGLGFTAAVVFVALNQSNLRAIQSENQYSAYFAEAGGLSTSSAVQVSGYKVGEVSSVTLDGARVLVKFRVKRDVRLGDRSEAAIKTKTLLGGKVLEIIPRGEERLNEPIPLERTTPPYELADALGDLSTTVDQLDTSRLSQSLATLAQTFSQTPPELQIAVQGLSRFSSSLNNRDEQLRKLLANANTATKVLAVRSEQVVRLIADSNALLADLESESTALEQISGNLSVLSRQLSGLVSDNQEQLHPAVEKLNGVLAIVANRRDQVKLAIHRVNAFAMSLGESVSSGPWFNAYIANLLPGQFVQPFIDAAFSDLGLDPNVLLPTELTDPQTGQPGTPPMPVPFPRTGQGGEPRLNLPDAITGNPGDPRYPFREPPVAPPPGGPPPGPPAPTSPPAAPTVSEPNP